MEGLPADFASNPHLAAIASLLEEDEDESSKKTEKERIIPVLGKAGGGKIMPFSREQRRRQAGTYQSIKRKSKAYMGEAHLFFKMWKL
jgi:hypothetical protein